MNTNPLLLLADWNDTFRGFSEGFVLIMAIFVGTLVYRMFTKGRH